MSCRLFASILLLLGMVGLVHAQPSDPEVHGTFGGDPMYTLLEVDAIPAIRVPTFVRGDEADQQMQDDEPVLGVVIDGEAHAYSLWQLDHHEIVNDTVGGRSIAATW